MVKLSANSQTPKKLPHDLAFYMLQIMPERVGLAGEPMFEYNEENYQKIAFLCDTPFASFGGEEKYKTLAEKAAALFFNTTKDHRLPNGNKRTAVILTCAFLVFNNKWIKLTHQELYDLSLEVAETNREDSEAAYKKVLKIFEERIIDIAEAEWLIAIEQ